MTMVAVCAGGALQEMYFEPCDAMKKSQSEDPSVRLLPVSTATPKGSPEQSCCAVCAVHVCVNTRGLVLDSQWPCQDQATVC